MTDSVEVLDNPYTFIRHYRSLCEQCGKVEGEARPSMTAYHWNGKGENPNRDVWLCTICSIEYCDVMESHWNDYYSMTR